MKKKILSALAVVGVPVLSVLAQGEVTHYLPQTDAQNGITAFTTMAGDLAAWSEKFLPIVVGVVGTFLIYWLVRLGIRLFKSFASSGK